ncbi:MAG: hypothetical protein EBX68_06200 [Betaproteobacteria bacterium]|nr:hypothetical protein [Betaproteobacteria bacterium]
MNASDSDAQALTRTIDVYLAALVFLAVEKSLQEDKRIVFTPGMALVLKPAIEAQYKLQFYETKRLPHFWDIRGSVSNELFVGTQHPLRFHFMKADHSASQLFTLSDIHDLGDCHAFYIDEGKRLRPLYHGTSARAPTTQELVIMEKALREHTEKVRDPSSHIS